jgi:hypothetical protein
MTGPSGHLVRSVGFKVGPAGNFRARATSSTLDSKFLSVIVTVLRLVPPGADGIMILLMRRLLCFELLEARQLLATLRLANWNTFNLPNVPTDDANYAAVMQAIGNESLMLRTADGIPDPAAWCGRFPIHSRAITRSGGDCRGLRLVLWPSPQPFTTNCPLDMRYSRWDRVLFK